MIRSILQIGTRKAPTADPGANKRGGGRIACEGIFTGWGEILNASASGLRLSARGRAIPEVGETAPLAIHGPEGTFSVLARVVWARHKNWGRREIGVQFVEVSPQARWHLARLAEAAARGTVLDVDSPQGS